MTLSYTLSHVYCFLGLYGVLSLTRVSFCTCNTSAVAAATAVNYYTTRQTRRSRSTMFGSMFETAAYHRGFQWPSAPSACGYSMTTFDPTPTSRLSSSAIRDFPRGHVPQSTAGYTGLTDHGRYTGPAAPLYDGRSAVRDVLFGCGRFSEPGGPSSALQSGISDVNIQSSSATTAFSPLSLPCVGHEGVTTSTGTATDCPPPPPPPRLPTAPYGYSGAGVTTTDDRYYGTATGVNGGTATFPGDVQSGGCGQPTTGFRSPALSLGFNPHIFMNDVIGEYIHLYFSSCLVFIIYIFIHRKR